MGPTMPTQFDIFVSYSSDDARLIDGLVRLMGLTGRRVFVDKNSIEPGAEWAKALREAVSSSQQMVREVSIRLVGLGSGAGGVPCESS
jgi:hypothetical protein